MRALLAAPFYHLFVNCIDFGNIERCLDPRSVVVMNQDCKAPAPDHTIEKQRGIPGVPKTVCAVVGGCDHRSGLGRSIIKPISYLRDIGAKKSAAKYKPHTHLSPTARYGESRAFLILRLAKQRRYRALGIVNPADFFAYVPLIWRSIAVAAFIGPIDHFVEAFQPRSIVGDLLAGAQRDGQTKGRHLRAGAARHYDQRRHGNSSSSHSLSPCLTCRADLSTTASRPSIFLALPAHGPLGGRLSCFPASFASLLVGWRVAS